MQNIWLMSGFGWLTLKKKKSVKSTYLHILNLQRNNGSDKGLSLNIYWSAMLPQILLFFAWRLLEDRLPMRELLVCRGIIIYMLAVVGDSCVLCFSHGECTSHLFFTCIFSYDVWSNIYVWLGIFGAFHWDSTNHISPTIDTSWERSDSAEFDI